MGQDNTLLIFKTSLCIDDTFLHKSHCKETSIAIDT